MFFTRFGATLTHARRSRFRHGLAVGAIFAVLFALIAGTAAAPAFADFTAVLDISQSVDHATDIPGNSFTYTISVDCSEESCVNATLTDTIPAEFNALTLNSTIAVTKPPEPGVGYTASWGGTNNRTLTVNFSEADASNGIAAGDGYTVQVTMSVPAGISPNFGSNGVAVANTASVSADNAATQTSATNVTVNVPITVNTAVTNSWSPSSTQYKVGEASTVTLTSRNTSNALATSLVLQYPANPTLASNPFENVTFSSFGSMTLPSGADQVFVDAYVAGAWVLGTTAETPSTLALPTGVSASQVDGLRFTFNSSDGHSDLVAGGTAASAGLVMSQRASTRTGGTSLVLGATTTGIASSTVTVPGQTPVTGTAQATYTVAGLNVRVTGAESFTPSRAPAGGSTVALITAGNSSNGPLSTLTVTDPGSGSFFSDKVVFNGFASTSTWPSGATDASIAWLVNTGTAPTSPDFTSVATMPGIPALSGGQYITGFVITYSGSIAAGATAGVATKVSITPDENTSESTPVMLANHIQVDGTNDAGAATPATAVQTLTILAPQILLTEVKHVTPTAALAPGGESTVQLTTSTSSDTAYVSPTSITIVDEEGASSLDYWNAFDATAIAPTQVPLGSTLQVSYTTDDGASWIDLPLVDATTTAKIDQVALPASSSINGLRFVFSNAGGYALSTIVSPYIDFEARTTLRDGSGPTAVYPAQVTYTNTATAAGDGQVILNGSPQDVSETPVSSSATAIVKALPSGDNGMLLSKAWTKVNGTTDVSSQSGEQRTATISWGTQLNGVNSALIMDPPDPTQPVASTVFQAFDLLKINPITTATDPLIAYDEVTDVELFDGTVWNPVSTCTPITPCIGGFAGFTLSPAQTASTVGVRIGFAPADSARTTSGLSPPVGSGISTSPTARPVSFLFQLRNQLRDRTAPSTPTSPWVTATDVYNATNPGVVSNTASLSMTTASGPVLNGTASTTINIIDTPPAVTSTKTAATIGTTNVPIPIPNPGDVPVANYPTASFTLTATNASAARAWALRVTDPMPCPATSVSSCAINDVGPTKGYTISPFSSSSVYDPTTNPFEQFTLTSITPTLSANSGIVLHASTVTLWHYNPATGVSTVTSVAGDSSTLTNAAALADVVGVSVEYTSTSTATGGQIAAAAVATTKLGVQLRQTLRSSSAQLPAPYVTASTATNNSFTQIYDDVLPDSSSVDASVYDSKSASISLVTGNIDVTASKSILNSSDGTSTLIEAKRGTDVSVNLGATSGNSSGASDRVVLTDDGQTTAFWGAFTLKSIGTIAPPLGSNQIEVDAQVDGSSTWTTQSPIPFTSPASPSTALPAGVTVAHVTGLRFIFTKTDGSIFSNTAPAAAWTASVPLTVDLRPTYLAGSTFAGTVTDTVLTSSTHPVFGTATSSATASFTLSTGTFSVDVLKTSSVAASPAGQFVDWTLQFTNTGSGYLNNPTVIDQLPVDASLSAGGPLLFDPTAIPAYTDSTGGILSTTTVIQSYNAATRQVTFSWPAGARLAPSEVYKIDLSLEVAPGLLSTYPNIVNRFTFGSDQTLASCTNLSGNQGFTLSGKTCATSNFITTLAASSITTFKGVKGNVDSSGNSTSGATNVSTPGAVCVSDSEGFYRAPCAANTVIGGTDLWKLQLTNGGNIPASAATIVDVLPHNGDTLLRSSTSRGSTFTPEFDGNLTLTTDSLSAGTTMVWEVTTDANPCQNYSTAPTCASTSWQAGASFPAASYSQVTGIRVTFDFSALSGATLPPAAGLKITYDTLNVPSLTLSDHRAPTTVPVVAAQAWNTFGAYAEFGSSSSSRLVEPVKAGVQLATGSIQITKVIAGSSASFAPVSYAVTATCTVDGAPVTLPNGGALALNASSTTPYTARIDGIPLGAVCDFVEAPSGASSVDYAPANSAATAAEVTVGTANSSADVVPAAQQATVTNTYGMTSLTVTKEVVQDPSVGTFGPFSFSLACTVDNGMTLLPVTFAGGSQLLTFSLGAGDSKEVDSLPVRSVCSLIETDSDHASSIAASIDGGAAAATAEGSAISVPLAAGSAHTAVVTNTFQGGQLAVTKTVNEATLPGDPTFGAGPFTVGVKCTYLGQTLYDSAGADSPISLVGGQTVTLSQVFPVGTSCAVAETHAGGATSSSGPVTVLIPAPTSGHLVGLVTTDITNTFAKGSLKVNKVINVAPNSIGTWGAGPFEATVTCTWVKDGTTLTIPLPNAGIVALTATNGYSATVTGLIAGASCGVVETKSGGATDSVVSAISPSTIFANSTSTVTITNTFDTGSLIINKVRAGTADAITRFGSGTYTAHVDCSYLSDGTVTPIVLDPSVATQTLSAANSYQAEIDGLLDGASCTVTETDPGLAVSSALSPANGTVTIVDGSQASQANVTITNTFAVGTLAIAKTASTSLTEGSASYDYTLTVTNTGTVNAPGVEVTDPIDPTLDVTNVTATGWTTCAVTGQGSTGYGGTLDCLLGSDLAAGSVAPDIVITVTVLDTISQDEIDNTAFVTSTSPIVDGGQDTADVPVKWLDVTASSVCVKDAPYLQYSVVAHNLDVTGHNLTVNWADSSGHSIHSDTSPLTTNGPVTGTLLWPGAAVDSAGDGIAWPGYRPALPGETPDWNGLVLDPNAYAYGLRFDPLITFSINPHRTVTVAYPAASVDCTSPQSQDIALTKTASVGHITPKVPFTYTLAGRNAGLGPVLDAVLTDPIPSSLHVTKITPAAAASGQPAWLGCSIAGRAANGGGGTVTCTLDRPLTYQEHAPDVVLSVFADATAAGGMVTNTATMTADGPGVSTLKVDSTALVFDGSVLGYTGYELAPGLTAGLGLGFLGLLFVGFAFLWRRFGRRGDA